MYDKTKLNLASFWISFKFFFKKLQNRKVQFILFQTSPLLLKYSIFIGIFQYTPLLAILEDGGGVVMAVGGRGGVGEVYTMEVWIFRKGSLFLRR